jgi:hypothetical protein
MASRGAQAWLGGGLEGPARAWVGLAFAIPTSLACLIGMSAWLGLEEWKALVARFAQRRS